MSTRKYYSSIWHLWGKDAVGAVENPWEAGVSRESESRILQLRAALWEIRRLIQEGTDRKEICERITHELEYREWSIVDDER